MLDRLHRAAAAAERNGRLIEILVLQAITFEAQNRGDEALSALEQALRPAEPKGFVRVFLDEGAPMVKLLRRTIAQDVHAAYALHLLNALGETAAVSQPLAEPLTERELQLLRRLAAGYSNQQIAQEPVVAVSTVKKHVNNIYGKLTMGSRTQAVARAREQGLLQARGLRVNRGVHHHDGGRFLVCGYIPYYTLQYILGLFPVVQHFATLRATLR